MLSQLQRQSGRASFGSIRVTFTLSNVTAVKYLKLSDRSPVDAVTWSSSSVMKKRKKEEFLLSEGKFERSPCTYHSSDTELVKETETIPVLFNSHWSESTRFHYILKQDCPFIKRKIIVPSLENRNAIDVHLHNATFKSRFLYWYLLKVFASWKEAAPSLSSVYLKKSSNISVLSKLTIFLSVWVSSLCAVLFFRYESSKANGNDYAVRACRKLVTK